MDETFNFNILNVRVTEGTHTNGIGPFLQYYRVVMSGWGGRADGGWNKRE